MRRAGLGALACAAALAGCVATPIQLPGPQLGTDGSRGGDLWQAAGVDGGLSDHLPTPPADDAATNLRRDLDYQGKSDAGASALVDAVPSELGPATDAAPSELGPATDAATSAELGASLDAAPSDSAAAGEKGQGADASKD